MAATFGSPMTDTVKTQQNFAFAVKNPTTFVAAGGTNWSNQDNSMSYLWNDKNVDVNADGKSIFDPSPIGWRLPIWGVWDDFQINSGLVIDNVATYTPTSAAYPALGRRDGSTAALASSTTHAYNWSATPSATTRAYRYAIVTTGAYITNGSDTRGFGMALRSIREN